MKINGEVDREPTNLYLGTSWKWVVVFTPQLLYPWGKNPWYPFDRRLGGPQYQSEWCGEEKILPLPGLELWPIGQAAHYQSYQLCSPSSCYFVWGWGRRFICLKKKSYFVRFVCFVFACSSTSPCWIGWIDHSLWGYVIMYSIQNTCWSDSRGGL